MLDWMHAYTLHLTDSGYYRYGFIADFSQQRVLSVDIWCQYGGSTRERVA